MLRENFDTENTQPTSALPDGKSYADDNYCQKEQNGTDRQSRGLRLLSGEDSFNKKGLTSQIDDLKDFFTVGSVEYNIPAVAPNDHLQLCRQLLCVLRLNGYPVDDRLIEDHIISRIANRPAQKRSKPAVNITKLRRDLAEFDGLLKAYLEGSPCYAYKFTVSSFDSLRRARLRLLTESQNALPKVTA